MATTLAPSYAVSRGRRPGRRARIDHGIRLAALSTLWLCLLAVTWWWEQGGGVRALGTWPDALTALGRITGLWSSVLLLAQVLLMARVPWLERAFGQDSLARVHRRVGFWSVDLMAAHVGLIVGGYAAGRLSAVPGTAWELTRDYPGMLLAVAGSGCLLMVAVTSVKAARGRLRYESWHLLHLYGYLGAGLALPHQLWTGADFLASPRVTAVWWAAWALVAASVLTWRVALPLLRTLRHEVRVTSVVPEQPGVVSVYLTGRGVARVGAEAGQFLVWRFLGREGWTRGHPYSLSAAPDGRSLRITVQDAGDGSGDVADLAPGTRALVEGPYGRLTGRARHTSRVALIGAGVGITPLRALAEGLDYAPGECVVLHRWRREPLHRHEWPVLARERGLAVLDLPGPRRARSSWLGAGVPGHVDDTQALLGFVPDIGARDVYVCGPTDWTASVVRSLRSAGVPDHQIHLETFAW